MEQVFRFGQGPIDEEIQFPRHRGTRAAGILGRAIAGGVLSTAAKRFKETYDAFGASQPPALVASSQLSKSSSFMGYSKPKSKRAKIVRIPRNVKITRPEVKTSVQNSITATPSSGGTLACFNGLAQGTGAGQRIGRDVKCIGLKWSFDVERNPTNAFTAASEWSQQTCRMLVVYDREALGALPNVTDVLNSADWRAVYNNNNVATHGCRFTILKDKLFNFDTTIVAPGSSATVTASAQKTYQGSMRLKHPTHFVDSATGTIAQILKGSIVVILIWATNINNNWSQNFNGTLYFVDT